MDLLNLNKAKKEMKVTKEPKEPKYGYVIDETGRLVAASRLTKQDKLNSKFYIVGPRIDNPDADGREEVILSICTKTRNYFSRYPEKSGYEHGRVVINRKAWDQTSLHILAKQLFSDGRIKRILLPDTQSKLPHGNIVAERERFFMVDPGETRIEYEVLSKDCSDRVRFDVHLKDINTGESLAVEIYVTHRTDKEKCEKIQRLKENAIEIDLSDLVKGSSTLETSVEDEIIRRMQDSIDHTIWLNNVKNNEIDNWFAGQVRIQLMATTKDKDIDGEWLAWAADNLELMTKCPRRDTLDNSDRTWPRERYVTENMCKDCPRFIAADFKIHSGIMICNQSDVPNSEIISIVAKQNII